MSTILVAGATGALGRHVLSELRAQGMRLRVLTRSKARGAELSGLADEIHVGDVTQPATLAGVCDGVERVFSCLGASVALDGSQPRPGFYAVDYHGNRALLDAARSSGVQRFVYVSVFRAEQNRHLEYNRAHADMARDLKASGLAYGLVCPTGFFSALSALVSMARSGRAMVIGDGSARSNPIHDADLARTCADVVMQTDNIEVDVGGPEVLTRRRMAELAFEALGTPARIGSLPEWLPPIMARVASPFVPRQAALLDFFGNVNSHDLIAPATGTQTLGDFFKSLVRAG